MIDREPIPMPTTAQRDRAVAAILAHGPPEPCRRRYSFLGWGTACSWQCFWRWCA